MTFEPTRLLAGAAVTLTVVGLALQVVSPPLGGARVSAPAAERAPAEVTPSGTARVSLDYEEIARLNPFTATRTPPPARYQPPGQAQVDTRAAVRAAAPPALYGIAAGPDGTVALIDADLTIPGAELYRVGDRVRDARVVAITDSTVVLDGPTGRRVLTLPTARRRTP